MPNRINSGSADLLVTRMSVFMNIRRVIGNQMVNVDTEQISLGLPR